MTGAGQAVPPRAPEHAGPAQLLQLAYDALDLKDVPRTGWVQHGVSLPESVAGHSWGTAYLCLLYATSAGVDLGEAAAMALLHDLAEATTGDVASRLDPADRQLSEAQKAADERAAIDGLLDGADPSLGALWQAYEARSSKAALFVRDMNVIDMCLQALKYERDRRYDPSVLVPSAGQHRHLDEFFEGARLKLTTDLGVRLYGAVRSWYEEAREANAP